MMYKRPNREPDYIYHSNTYFWYEPEMVYYSTKEDGIKKIIVYNEEIYDQIVNQDHRFLKQIQENYTNWVNKMTEFILLGEYEEY